MARAITECFRERKTKKRFIKNNDKRDHAEPHDLFLCIFFVKMEAYRHFLVDIVEGKGYNLMENPRIKLTRIDKTGIYGGGFYE